MELLALLKLTVFTFHFVAFVIYNFPRFASAMFVSRTANKTNTNLYFFSDYGNLIILYLLALNIACYRCFFRSVVLLSVVFPSSVWRVHIFPSIFHPRTFSSPYLFLLGRFRTFYPYVRSRFCNSYYTTLLADSFSNHFISALHAPFTRMHSTFARSFLMYLKSFPIIRSRGLLSTN